MSVTPGSIVQEVYNLALMVGGLLAFGAIVFGAIQYTLAAGNPSGQHEGREWITQALLGLLLLVGAALVLGTINPKLLTLELPGSDVMPPLKDTPTGGGPGSGASNLSQSEVQAQLTNAGITIEGPIVLAGLQPSTINELAKLKIACGCEVVITSATGGVHEVNGCTHSNGYKADIRVTPSLTNYILDKFQPAGAWSNGNKLYRPPAGQGVGLYAHEIIPPPNPPASWAPHWDMAMPC